MTLRGLLIAASVLLASILVAFSDELIARIVDVLQDIPAYWVPYIIAAVFIQLGGHWLRALRTKTIIDFVKESRARGQFGALSIGYLFNVLMPFRIGELIRALVIATRLQISFLYTFVVVALERIIDLLLIGILVVVMSLVVGKGVASVVLMAALGAILFSLVSLILLTLLVQENKHILSIIWRISGWLNVSISNKFRFKIWSLIFGLQQFITRKQAVRKYILLTLTSWACYLTSVAVLLIPVIPGVNPSHVFIATTAPYVAASASANPGDFTKYDEMLTPVIEKNRGVVSETAYVVLSWMLLTLPMCFLGFAALFILRFHIARRGRRASSASFANKLLRQEDISQEFPAFLDTYFQGHSLSRVLHKIEVSGALSLVKFFKGGSDAVTILVLAKEKLYVKKIIPIEYEGRLKAQYDWLVKHDKLSHLVRALGEQRTNEYYSIDLEYDSENIPLFEYVHSASLAQSKEVVSTVWNYLHKHIHAKAKELKYRPRDRNAYVKKHIFDCIDQAALSSPTLRQALDQPTITINGQEYDNLYQIIEKIRKCPQAWRDIATYQRSGIVHGDMAIDNILVSPKSGKPLIIDPAPDGNIIDGPVFDLGKLAQSFYCGYEFLFRNDDPVALNEDGSINYRDHRSAAYTHLWDYLCKEMAPKYLSEEEQRSLLFHAAALHIRVLKHRVYINPDNVLQFYATGVRTFNAFLKQYDESREK